MAGTILIKNIAPSVTEQELTELLAAHGRIENVELAAAPEAEEEGQIAFVTMRSTKHGRAVMAALDGLEHAGRVLDVKPMKGHSGPSINANGGIAPQAHGRRAGAAGGGHAGTYGHKGRGKAGGRNS